MKIFSLKTISKPFLRQTIFSVLAIGLLLVLAFIVIYSTSFILENSESALDVSVSPAPAQRFDLQGYEKLQIIKQKKTE